MEVKVLMETQPCRSRPHPLAVSQPRNRPAWLASLTLAAALLPFGASTSAEEPYRLLVCLHFSDDPLFTRLYTNSIQRQVQDQLANYFSAAAQVQVVTSHPLIERLGSADVRSLQLASAEFVACEVPDKAFVFSLENVEGVYHLHWRQLDGLSQQTSAPQSMPTPDRQWVAKAVCMAVKEDFAPVVILKPDDRVKGTGQVRLEFPSPKHKELAQRWLTLNTILQPFWVIQQKDGLVRVPIPNTVLRISRNDAGDTATFYSNASNPWKPTPRLVRYEALKLNTQKGHLRIKLVNAADGLPLLQCVVRANNDGFAALGDVHQFTLPDRRGTVVSLAPIDRLAFVEIAQGDLRLQVPIPITAGVCEVTLKVPRNESAREKSDWERRLRYLVQDVSILQTSINNQVHDTNKMHDEKKYEEELRLIKSVLSDVSASLQSSLETKGSLDAEASQLKVGPNSLLTWVNAQLKEIANTEKNLDTKAKDLRKMLDTMAASDRAQALINAGRAAAEIGDYDEALSKYQLALNEPIKQPKLEEEVRRLRSIWGMRSPELDQARAFIRDRWATSDVTELSKLYGEAERALSTLVQVGDYLTAQRLLKANNEHCGALAGVIDLLVSSGTERDVEDAEKYKQLLDNMADFQQRIGDFIKTAETGTASAPASATSPAMSTPPPEEEAAAPKKN
jgi:tetratricopeptide (TPR) repeat protein